MRIVVLCSSVYSETACAVAVRLSGMGYVPTGVLSFSTLNRVTLLRKLGQWGVRDVVRYASTKLFAQPSREQHLHNPEFKPLLQHGDKKFRSMRDVAKFYGFPVAFCHDQNEPDAIARLREWSPDLILFTGGNILRKQLLDVPRLGVLNVHLGLLPEVRGMSTPEWSLLKRVPAGITIHYMDEGIDTGPVLQRYEYPDAARCESLAVLRNRLIAVGIEQVAEVVAALDRGRIVATPQSDLDGDNQFFVMHDWLRARATERLRKNRLAAAVTTNG
jgi:folate-dependent phosphoribosylglycinamide formyltransferase PurN